MSKNKQINKGNYGTMKYKVVASVAIVSRKPVVISLPLGKVGLSAPVISSRWAAIKSRMKSLLNVFAGAGGSGQGTTADRLNAYREIEANQFTDFLLEVTQASTSGTQVKSPADLLQIMKKEYSFNKLDIFALKLLGFLLVSQVEENADKKNVLNYKGKAKKAHYEKLEQSALFSSDKGLFIKTEDLTKMILSLSPSEQNHAFAALTDTGWFSVEIDSSGNKLLSQKNSDVFEFDILTILAKALCHIEEKKRLAVEEMLSGYTTEKVDNIDFTNDFEAVRSFLKGFMRLSTELNDVKAMHGQRSLLSGVLSKAKRVEQIAVKLFQGDFDDANQYGVIFRMPVLNIFREYNSTGRLIQESGGELSFNPTDVSTLGRRTVLSSYQIDAIYDRLKPAAKEFLEGKHRLVISAAGYGMRLLVSGDFSNKNLVYSYNRTNLGQMLQNEVDKFIALYKNEYQEKNSGKVCSRKELIEAAKDFFQNKFHADIVSNPHFMTECLKSLLNKAENTFEIDGIDFSFEEIFMHIDVNGNNVSNISFGSVAFNEPNIIEVVPSNTKINNIKDKNAVAAILGVNVNDIKVINLFGQRIDSNKVTKRVFGVELMDGTFAEIAEMDPVFEGHEGKYVTVRPKAVKTEVSSGIQAQRGHIDVVTALREHSNVSTLRSHGFGGGRLFIPKGKSVSELRQKLDELPAVTTKNLATARENCADIMDGYLSDIGQSIWMEAAQKEQKLTILPADKANPFTGDYVAKGLMLQATIDAKDPKKDRMSVWVGPANPAISNQGIFFPIEVKYKDDKGLERRYLSYIQIEGGNRAGITDEAFNAEYQAGNCLANIGIISVAPTTSDVVNPVAAPLLTTDLLAISQWEERYWHMYSQKMFPQLLFALVSGEGHERPVSFVSWLAEEKDRAFKDSKQADSHQEAMAIANEEALKTGEAYALTIPNNIITGRAQKEAGNFNRAQIGVKNNESTVSIGFDVSKVASLKLYETESVTLSPKSMNYVIGMTSQDVERAVSQKGVEADKLLSILEGFQSNEVLQEGTNKFVIAVNNDKDSKALKEALFLKGAIELKLTETDTYVIKGTTVEVIIVDYPMTYKVDANGKVLFDKVRFAEKAKAAGLSISTQQYLTDVLTGKEDQVGASTLLKGIAKLSDQLEEIGKPKIGTDLEDVRRVAGFKLEAHRRVMYLLRGQAYAANFRGEDKRRLGTGKFAVQVMLRRKAGSEAIYNSALDALNNPERRSSEAIQKALADNRDIYERELRDVINKPVGQPIQITSGDNFGTKVSDAINTLETALAKKEYNDGKNIIPVSSDDYVVDLRIVVTPSRNEADTTYFHPSEDLDPEDYAKLRGNLVEMAKIWDLATGKTIGSTISNIFSNKGSFSAQTVVDIIAPYGQNERVRRMACFASALNEKKGELQEEVLQNELSAILLKSLSGHRGRTILDDMNSDLNSYVQMMMLSDVPQSSVLYDQGRLATAVKTGMVYVHSQPKLTEDMRSGAYVLATTNPLRFSRDVVMAVPKESLSSLGADETKATAQLIARIAEVGDLRQQITLGFRRASENSLFGASFADPLRRVQTPNGAQAVFVDEVTYLENGYNPSTAEFAPAIPFATYQQKVVTTFTATKNVAKLFAGKWDTGDQFLLSTGLVLSKMSGDNTYVGDDVFLGNTQAQVNELLNGRNSTIAINIDESQKLSLRTLSQSSLDNIEKSNGFISNPFGPRKVSLNLEGKEVAGQGRIAKLSGNGTSFEIADIYIQGEVSPIIIEKVTGNILRKLESGELKSFDLGDGFKVTAIKPELITETKDGKTSVSGSKVSLIISSEGVNLDSLEKVGIQQLDAIKNGFKIADMSAIGKITDEVVSPKVLRDAVSVFKDLLIGINGGNSFINVEVKDFFDNNPGRIPKDISALFLFMDKKLSVATVNQGAILAELATLISSANVRVLIGSLGLREFSNLLAIFNLESFNKAEASAYADIYKGLINLATQANQYYGPSVSALLSPLIVKYSQFKTPASPAKPALADSMPFNHSNTIPSDMYRGVKVLPNTTRVSYPSLKTELEAFFPSKVKTVRHEIEPNWLYNMTRFVHTDVPVAPADKTGLMKINNEEDYREILSLLVLKNLGFTTTLRTVGDMVEIYRDGYAEIDEQEYGRSVESLPVSNLSETMRGKYQSTEKFLIEADSADLETVFSSDAAKSILKWREVAGALGKDPIDLSAFKLNGTTADGKYKVVVSSIPDMFQGPNMARGMVGNTYQTYTPSTLVKFIQPANQTVDMTKLLNDMRGLLRPGTSSAFGQDGPSKAAFLCGVFYKMANEVLAKPATEAEIVE